MNKLIVTAAALLVLTGSTLSVSAASKKPSQPTKTDVVPCCPPNDPKGCGIFDN